MARLVTSGFELSQATTSAGQVDGALNGVGTIDTTNQRSGAACMSFDASGTLAASSWPLTGVLGRSYYMRAYFSKSANPAATTRILGPQGLNAPSARLGTDGTIQLWNGVGGTPGSQVGSSSAVQPSGLGTYFRVELRVLYGTGAIDEIELYVNGSQVAVATGQTLSESAPSGVFVGWVDAAGVGGPTLLVDDVAVNDDQGASQASWPGDGKVVLLKPISDNAVGAGWTLGTGTAIASNSGSTAVKNTPPLGVADLAAGSDVKMIRNASANANTNYDANLTTYTTAGVGASDTINVLDPIVNTSAPVVTSAKAGTIGISSNPVIANIALGAAGTAGAFWQGNAGGTYPTGWKWSHGTTTYAPSVTVGSSPVARITQVTSSTRIADVDFLGMYVDYTPFVAATTKKLAALGVG